MSKKYSQICEICISWMQENPNNNEWLRCGCGNHVKIVKKIITVISEPDLEEKLRYLDKLAGFKKDE